MPYRPLAIVSGLTVGDYALWNWSLNANHDVLSLVAGLTLPPLAILCVWLVAITGARLLARGTGRAGQARARKPTAKAPRATAAGAPKPASAAPRATPAPTSARSSRRIAA